MPSPRPPHLKPPSGYQRVRAVLDRAVAAVALVLISPVLVVTGLLIALDGGPVFFRQKRLGLGGREFSVIKFRTMIVDAEKHVDERLRPTRNRITPVGRVLRKTSIDELPQLVNVLRGEMALIGPRPILPVMQPYMTAREHERFAVPPGVTGLAQVKGRNRLKWSRRFNYDIVYARRMSPRVDLYILCRTIRIVLTGSDISLEANPDEVNDVMRRPLP